jgi:hypothetical protein
MLWGVPAVLLALVLIAAVVTYDVWKEKSMPVKGEVVAAVDDGQLAVVDRTRVFFGHQSVGENILGGVEAIYSRQGLVAPPIEENGSKPGPAGGFISHAYIGANEQPRRKIDDFAQTLRRGLGERVDVAMMKFCFLDISTRTDVDALFAHYQDTIAALQKEYPAIAFVHVTVPLTTDSGIKNRIKIMLGGSDRYGQGENVARHRYNELLRQQYGDDRLFDLAAIESTTPDGGRQEFRYRDQPYYALHTGYASDLGHLNPEGSEIAASAFLQAIASASSRR